MDLEIGQIYADKYRIIRQLGQGGMGAVYEAENVRIHRKVAIKALHPHVAEKQDTLMRFEREAQAAGRIGSKHIVEVLDLGELSDGTRYMVMEFLDGSTLEQRIRSRGRLSPEEATPILRQILDGLGAAHAAQIIHRDLKPANIFVAPTRGGDLVKILDFGVSKFNVLGDEMSMTSTGAVLGTPYYMSPEQAKGSREIDWRSDLYAVGVILYECITGQVPFSAETFNELLFRIVLESPPPVESFVPNLDPAFRAIIHKAMAREVAERFQTAQEFAEALDRWLAQANAGPVVGPPGALAGGGTFMMQAPGHAAPGQPAHGPSLAGGGTFMMGAPQAQPQQGGYAPAPQGAYAPAPQGAYAPAPQGGYTQALQGGYAPAPQAGGYAPAPQGGYAPAPQAGAYAPAQGGYAPAPQAGGYAPAPNPAFAGPVSQGDPVVIPKQGFSVIVFVLGFVGVLVLGGIVLYLVRRDPSPAEGAAAASASAVVAASAAAPPPDSAASAPPEPAAEASAPPAASAVPSSPPVAVGAQPPRPGRSGSNGPKPAGTGQGKKGPAPGNKRTISTEL